MSRRHHDRVASARAAWTKLRKVLARPLVGEAITINDNFVNAGSDVAALLKARRPLVVGVQEGYRRRLRKDLSRVLWGVRQRLHSDGTAGVAVLWDRTRLRAIGRNVDRPHLLGHGWQALIDVADTRVRGVVWQDLVVRARWLRSIRDRLAGRTRPHRLRFRAGSAHRLPARDRQHWPAQDRPLAAWILASPLPVLLLMDCNEPGGPSGLLELLEDARPGRYRWIGDGIDGAVTDLDPAAAAEALARRTSDHRPVSIPLNLDTKEHS